MNPHERQLIANQFRVLTHQVRDLRTIESNIHDNCTPAEIAAFNAAVAQIRAGVAGLLALASDQVTTADAMKAKPPADMSEL